jgi:hypothetical protein
MALMLVSLVPGAAQHFFSGALQTRDRSRLRHLERSRTSGAPLRIAREDGRNALMSFALHRIRDTMAA